MNNTVDDIIIAVGAKHPMPGSDGLYRDNAQDASPAWIHHNPVDDTRTKHPMPGSDVFYRDNAQDASPCRTYSDPGDDHLDSSPCRTYSNPGDDARAKHSGVHHGAGDQDNAGNASPLRGNESESERERNGGHGPLTQCHGTVPGSLSAMMQNFQSVTTRKINKIRKTPGQRLWQRNYWEHIIINERELNRIRQYIYNNPSNWSNDENNIHE